MPKTTIEVPSPISEWTPVAKRFLELVLSAKLAELRGYPHTAVRDLRRAQALLTDALQVCDMTAGRLLDGVEHSGTPAAPLTTPTPGETPETKEGA